MGGTGFLVDVAVLWAGIACGLGPYWGRALSATCSGLTTWRLNRRFTFDPVDGPQWVEGVRYAGTLALCCVVNFTLYAILTASGVPPLLALCIAAGIVLLFSFFVFRALVFRTGAA